MKDHNIGLDLHRLFLAFLVVLCHFWSPIKENSFHSIINSLRVIATPTFFLLSFFLTSKSIIDLDEQKHIKRIQCIFYPFFFWGLVTWCIYAVTAKAGTDKNTLVMSLVWQILTGHVQQISPPLWYLLVLGWMTILYSMIFKLGKRIGFTIAVLMMIGALVLQYTGINYWLFSDLAYEVRYPFGRIVEMIPYATLGLILGSFYRDSKEDDLWMGALIGAGLLLLYCVSRFFPFPVQAKGFGYPGIMKIVGSVGFLILFYSLGFFLKFLSENMISIIRILSAHTLGIFCMHYKIGNVIKQYSNGKLSGFILCVVVYITCYFIAFLISRIPGMKKFVD